MRNKNKNKEQKSRGRPISLYPLEVEEALKDILKVRPSSKSKKNSNRKE